jgi:hypothetical protein
LSEEKHDEKVGGRFCRGVGILDRSAGQVAIARRAGAVAAGRANAYGLYDMAGNVWQWVNDWYGRHCYRVSPAENPPIPVPPHRPESRAWSIRCSFFSTLRCEGRICSPDVFPLPPGSADPVLIGAPASVPKILLYPGFTSS